MIKPLHMPQLSSAKPRSGLQSVADLLPRLIRQYEIQAEARKRQAVVSSNQPRQSSNAKSQQATFAWFEG